MGTGRMGKCLASLLCDHCDLTVCSRDLGKAKLVASRTGAKAAGVEGCTDREVVFLAVPNASLIETAGKVSRIMSAGSLLVDISSVKCGVIEEVEKVLPPGTCYISIHPLFSSPRVNEKNTIVVPVRPGNWMPALRGLLLSSGMKLKEADAIEHDKAMAAVQVVHHFALLTMRSTLAEMGFQREGDLEPFMTRSLRRSFGVIRLLARNIETIEMIQKDNKFSRRAREKFLEEARKLDRRYRKNTDGT